MPRRAVPAARRFAGGRTQRQPTNWARLVFGVEVAVAAGTKVLVSTIILSNPGINETIRRTRGVASTSSVVSGAYHGAMGFVVVNDLAVAAGAASIPGPGTDASDDGWFVWQPMVWDSPLTTASESHTWAFDSKAMRRVEEGFAVAVMVENLDGTQSFNFSMGFSILTSLT